MRITCGLEIANRNAPSVTNRKHSVATLALCPKSERKKLQSDEDVCLLLCTRQNPRGPQYKVFGNVDKLFEKFVNEGKATIRFKEPPHDLLISKANPLQLKAFLHAVSLTSVGQASKKIQVSQGPIKVGQLPKKKLSIKKRSDFPIKGGFPDSLTKLQVQDCHLCRVDLRILRLKNLQVLDLANNCLRELSLELGSIPLRELVLHHNELSSFPSELATSVMGQNLRLLDLSFNKIHNLSPYFCLMKNICVLSLQGNGLQKLPRNIHHFGSSLKFDVSSNELKVLPYGIWNLQLDSLYLNDNPLDTAVVLSPMTPWQLPSLLECAASAVVSQNVPYTSEYLPKSLNDYLINHCFCPCGERVFQNASSCIKVMNADRLTRYETLASIISISHSNSEVPFEFYFCSMCWKQRNERQRFF